MDVPLVYLWQGQTDPPNSHCLIMMTWTACTHTISTESLLPSPKLVMLLSFPQVPELWPPLSLSQHQCVTIPSGQPPESPLATRKGIPSHLFPSYHLHTCSWFFPALYTAPYKGNFLSTCRLRGLQILGLERSCFTLVLLYCSSSFPYHNHPSEYTLSWPKARLIL